MLLLHASESSLVLLLHAFESSLVLLLHAFEFSLVLLLRAFEFSLVLLLHLFYEVCFAIGITEHPAIDSSDCVEIGITAACLGAPPLLGAGLFSVVFIGNACLRIGIIERQLVMLMELEL